MLSFMLSGIESEIISNSDNDILDVSQSSVSTSSLLNTTSGGLQKVSQSKQKKTLRFVKDLKNVTKEAGGFLRLRCDVTGSKPATNFEWFKNEAPLMEGNNLISIQVE